MAVSIRLAVPVLLVSWCSLVLSFNLEPRIPIVKKGSPKSHFGYTVAQHQTILQTLSGQTVKKPWILVGAPKDHNLQPGTNRSGALWKCPLTTFTTDCQQVRVDGFRNSNDSLAWPGEDEIKDDQWLGVTLKSQKPGGKVLICAHRYMTKGKGYQWGFGLCYILSNTLDLLDNLEPCRGKPVDKSHEQYGFCQAGTSGLLLEDEAVLGVPGPFTWRGTVHTSNISDNFLLKDKTQYFSPVTETDSPVDKYSYLGYSVTAGHFFGNYMSYVGGAPRAAGTGQVVFFSRERIGESVLQVSLILSGEKFASSFGYEVLALDINGDKKHDLIVGAPFYFTGTASGAVYVYMNNDGGFVSDHPYTKIEGAAGESRFGSSMTSLGDLNHDGFLDVAVGAPYEGRGAIYVYLGSSKGLVTEPAQVIRAEDMPGTPYNAFGYSLSGGMDLDENGYPDLLTSSFCSDRVLLLRARPIIDLQTTVISDGQLENIDPSRKGCTDDVLSTETCFSFDACFKMDNSAGATTNLKLKYTIQERLYKDRPLARVRFADGLENQRNEVQRDISLRQQDMGLNQCTREVVYLLDGPRDILRPLRFKLTYEIIQREPRPVREGQPVPDINNYPILNQQEALKYFEGTFAKDCGDDDICNSDLNVIGRLDLERHPTLNHYLLKLGKQNVVPLLLEVTNSGEPAYEASLLVTHHEALVFENSKSEVGSYECSAEPGAVKCSLGNPLTDTTGPLKLSFSESGNAFDSRFINFTVYANSSSTENTPQDPLHFRVEVIKRAEISIIGSVTPEQVFYGGEVVGESAIKHLEDIGMEVTHKYVVHNAGPWRVDELQVEVLWPHQVENGKDQGKWLLYMTELPSVAGLGECKVDPSLINPLVLRRTKVSYDTLTGNEVKGEIDTADLPEPGREEVPDSTDVGGEAGAGAGSGSVKITKTTTKKVTTITTKKNTSISKSSSEKGFAETTERTSSSNAVSTSQSSSDSYDANEEGSGFGGGSSRIHGRTHTRVSRRVYSSSDRSRFDDNHLGIDDIGGDTDDSGRVVSHHEETRHSSGSSPDGRSTFHKTHHESRKVIAYEDTNDENLPRGRWGQGGGYRPTHVEPSTHRPDGRDHSETRAHWETRTYPSGRGNEDRWGDSNSDTYSRRDESWREHSSTHTVDSNAQTHSSGHERDGAEGNYRRTNEESSVTHTDGYDNTHLTEGTGRGHGQGRDRDETDRNGWPDDSERTGQNWKTGSGRHREGRVFNQGNPDRVDEDSYRRTGDYEYRKSESDHSRVPEADRYDSRTFSGSRTSHTEYQGRSSTGGGYNSHGSDYRNFEDDTERSYSSTYDRRGGRHDSRGGQIAGTVRTSEDGGWGQGNSGENRQLNQGYSRSDSFTRTRDNLSAGQDISTEGNFGGHGDSRTHLAGQRSHGGDARTYTWQTHSSSGGEHRGTSHYQRNFNNRDNLERHGPGGASDRRFIHLDSDGPFENGTYMRAEVDPQTGQSSVYTRKVVYNKWPTHPADPSFPPAEEQELIRSQRSASRVKRERELIIKPQAVTDAKTGKTMQVVNLRCDGPATAKCFIFRCKIRNLGEDRTATIHIKSRLWNSTLVEDYPRVSYVSIKSKGSLILPEDIREDQDQSDDVASAETLAYPDLLDQLPPEEVPLWVILVSIFAGLLVLIIIILILWKLGFFERKRPDPTLSGNLDKDANGY